MKGDKKIGKAANEPLFMEKYFKKYFSSLL